MAFCVVPVVCYSNASCTCPFVRKFVVFLVCIFEMLGMFLANAFYSEVVDNQCELYWSCVVFPKAEYHFALLVTVFVQTFLEEFAGQ
jgi:hypothetical protein